MTHLWIDSLPINHGSAPSVKHTFITVCHFKTIKLFLSRLCNWCKLTTVGERREVAQGKTLLRSLTARKEALKTGSLWLSGDVIWVLMETVSAKKVGKFIMNSLSSQIHHISFWPSSTHLNFKMPSRIFGLINLCEVISIYSCCLSIFTKKQKIHCPHSSDGYVLNGSWPRWHLMLHGFKHSYPISQTCTNSAIKSCGYTSRALVNHLYSQRTANMSFNLFSPVLYGGLRCFCRTLLL